MTRSTLLLHTEKLLTDNGYFGNMDTLEEVTVLLYLHVWYGQYVIGILPQMADTWALRNIDYSSKVFSDVIIDLSVLSFLLAVIINRSRFFAHNNILCVHRRLMSNCLLDPLRVIVWYTFLVFYSNHTFSS